MAAAMTSDAYRIEFLGSHLLAIGTALAEGVSVRACHAWSSWIASSGPVATHSRGD